MNFDYQNFVANQPACTHPRKTEAFRSLLRKTNCFVPEDHHERLVFVRRKLVRKVFFCFQMSRLLFIAIDCSPLHWSSLESQLSFVEFFENILLYIQNYLLLNSSNKFNVILFDNVCLHLNILFFVRIILILQNRTKFLVDNPHFLSDSVDFESIKGLLIDSFKDFFITSGMGSGL